MRIAIFSDVHGNLSALKAVLADIDNQEDIDTVIFAGDLCLFGPRPEACLNLLREHDEISSIHGNTDLWIDGPPLLSDDIEEEERERWQRVHDITSWTREKLPEMDRAWLRELPFRRRISPSTNPRHDLYIVHANPVDVNQIIYPNPKQQKKLFDEVRQEDHDLSQLMGDVIVGILAFGHLHVPFVREWNDMQLVNVSSVSMPGDGDSRAKYALFHWDGDSWTIEHRRVEYDVQEEVDAFRREQPPGWQESVQTLEQEGMIAQRV